MPNVIVFVLTFTIFTVFAICAFIYDCTDGKEFKLLFHDILEWHIPESVYRRNYAYTNSTIKGINIHAKCKICGKDIIQDSQGNWFCK